MKFRTTEREIRQRANGSIIRVGYCNLQTLLQYENPIAYTCGVYGWNADIYEVGGCLIVEGYRPFGNYAPSHELTKKYEALAEKVLHDKRIRNYSTKARKLRELLDAFCREVIG